MNALPLWSLSFEAREVGLVAGALVGFGMGFVLERAGFGRAQKLVGQFYGNDMTVFKVMFSAIVTAMLGTVVLDGLGVIDLRAVADFATSGTYLWPMIVGGLMLGAGFIISGYCPGTSVVAAASGKLDGLATIGGVIAGSVIYSELQPALGAFHTSGDLGHFYLYDWLGVPPAVVAAGVTVLAVTCFVGAEALERVLNKTPRPERAQTRPGRLAWAGLGLTAAVGMITLFIPISSQASLRKVESIGAEALAQRVIAAPWTVRVIDLRAAEACAAARVPGAECVPVAELPKLALADTAAAKELVLIGDAELAAVPEAALAYPGRVLALQGGFEAWKHYALTAPEPLTPEATPAQREAYQLRSGLHAALTGVKQAPPPPPTMQAAPPKKKAGGGGCGG